MPIVLDNLRDRVQDGFIRIQGAAHTGLNAILRAAVANHLRSGARNVNAFSENVFNILKQYAQAGIPGLSDASISQFIEPLIQAAQDLDANRSQSLTNLYRTIDNAVDGTINNANRESLARSIAGANVIDPALATIYDRYQDLNTQFGLNLTDLSRLDIDILREVNRRYL